MDDLRHRLMRAKEELALKKSWYESEKARFDAVKAGHEAVKAGHSADKEDASRRKEWLAVGEKMLVLATLTVGLFVAVRKATA